MIPNVVIYLLAAIGALVVLVAALVASWLALGTALILTEGLLYWIDRRVFYAAGGEAGQSGDGRLPRPPFDRLWVELRWLADAMKWVETKLGYANYVNPGTRPDLDRLYELRAEDHGQGRWGWLPDWLRRGDA